MSLDPTLDLAPELRRPLRRVEYDHLVSLGAFEDEPIELLCGTLVRMSPQDASHAGAIQRLTRLFTMALAGRADLRVQLPLAISEDSEPEPDLAIVPVAETDDHHPSSALLVVEVAVSSLAIDRNVKASLYAGAGIAEYWVVNVPAGMLEVFTEPMDGAYRRASRIQGADVVTLTAFPDVSFAASQILR